MVCDLGEGKKIFIDGGDEVVSATLVIGKHEYWIGYVGNAETYEDNVLPLQDCYSDRILGNKYSF